MDLTPEQLKKIQEFQWGDTDDDLNRQHQPEMKVCDSILDCVETVAQYVVDNLNLLDLQQDVYQVNVPIETHPLLASRFDKKWSEYSRFRIFDLLRTVFIQKVADFGYLSMIEDAVREVFPREFAQIRVSHIDFYDEPEVDITVTNKCMNPVTGEERVVAKSHDSSGNTITVEVKIEIIESSEGLASASIV